MMATISARAITIVLLGFIVPLLFLHTACGAKSGVSVQLFGAGTVSADEVLQAWAKAYRNVRDDVSIAYEGTMSITGLSNYTHGLVDFVCMDRGLPPDAVDAGLLQFPLFGQALAVAYNLPSLAASDGNSSNLVLDRETLGAIWAGDITMWNDQRIRDLNSPEVAAKLPAATITLGYNVNGRYAMAEVFKVALSSFSERFRTVLAAANDSFALMPPALAGNAFEAGMKTAIRGAWLKNTTYGMTFLKHTYCTVAGVPWVNMVNRAGKAVAPSVVSVQAAMSDFSANISAGNLTIDFVDAHGNDSWPLVFTTFLAINQSATAIDCTNVAELLGFIAWTLTNDEAAQEALTIGAVTIDVSLRKEVIDLISRVACNGEQASPTSYLIGTGPPLPLYTAWTVAYSTAQARFKYFDSTSLQAKQQLRTFDEHFGTTSNGLEATWYSSIDDVTLLPATIYAIVPGYNVRELDGLELVLDYDTIAAIYLGEVTMWNDARIQAVNTPDVAAALPGQAIRVVTLSVAAAITQLFTTMLNATVPAFASQVGAGPLITFPVALRNTTQVLDSIKDLPITLATTDYGFAFINHYDSVLSRTLNPASLRKADGETVQADAASVESAVRSYFASNTDPEFIGIILSQGSGSWPLATFGSFIYHRAKMEDCAKSRALASFLDWTQNSPQSRLIAQRQGFILASSNDHLHRRLLNQLKAFTCNGTAVSALHNCINDSKLCSDTGQCINNTCVCSKGRQGQYCESLEVTSSPDHTITIVATIVPVLLALMVLSACLTAFLVLRHKKQLDDWEINYDELEIGEQLGVGGYGEVYKAMWKGTEVAVKVIASEKITKDMEKSFHDEVRVMTSLRHPHVVLFMAASTRAPKMCIVMEYMSLGSLYDLLHNELIPDIPFVLKAKMAYQASKGMHFLHSSGIVHRDLKSLNLLLDAKWNVKVSDFGLTKLKVDGRKGGHTDIAGSVHWMAPEVLNEMSDIDFTMADVYSFGIIMWELLTREQPYFGMSPAAVAVAVIRDGIRPQMPDEQGTCPPVFEELITSCWHSDPTIRPTFLEIMTRLSSMHGESTSGNMPTFTLSSSSSRESGGVAMNKARKSIDGSWSLPSIHGSTSSEASSSSSSPMSAGEARGPEGEVALVFTDITRAASLWEFNAPAMLDAMVIHNETLRATLQLHIGYETVSLGDWNSGEGSFCMAFQQVSDAVAWCCDVQLALLEAEWPEALLEHPGAAEVWSDDRVLYKGPRVRMCVHVGAVKTVRDALTRRTAYFGPVVDVAACLTAMVHGGQIALSHAAYEKLSEPAASAALSTADANGAQDFRVQRLGRFDMPDAPQGVTLYEVKVKGLESRIFDGVADNLASSSSLSNRGRHKSKHLGLTSNLCTPSPASTNSEMQTAVGEGMQFKEDTFLTSANLCRWIIDFGDIQLGKQIGLGSYGVVFGGKWKGVEVAVKRFIKQKLDERRMLEFRAEMAFLSELHHPNIVLFIGACVKKPNLCIVTEFMKQGSLRDILANSTIKLAWRQKLKMLRSAALGINYLHSLHPVIVHRDLKPSNLLVDENWNVKVADFGFARIKEENATMTRCGTPCWTAPEIIRGDKYDERADVFSFGVVMWQVVTRKEPFAGRNFMGVSLDVLEGKRPQIPHDCPAELRKVMKKCWHASAERRLTMERVVAFFDKKLGAGPGSDEEEAGAIMNVA